MDWSDKRVLAEIPFAQDFTLSPEEREKRQEGVRQILSDAGVKTAEDIVGLGCTGLMLALAPDALQKVIFVRANITGSGVGLPCYVGPDKFCLVHNVIGGLQGQQKQRWPEGVPLVSRELTPEEKKHADAIQAMLDKEAESELKKRLGNDVEVKRSPFPTKEDLRAMNMAMEEEIVGGAVHKIGGTVFPHCTDPTHNHALASLPPRNGFVLPDHFICPEHSNKEPVWKCRFCLAAVIINGPFEPILMVDTELVSVGAGCESDKGQGDPIAFLEDALHGEENDAVGSSLELFVRVAHWTRKLVREDD